MSKLVGLAVGSGRSPSAFRRRVNLIKRVFAACSVNRSEPTALAVPPTPGGRLPPAQTPSSRRPRSARARPALQPGRTTCANHVSSTRGERRSPTGGRVPALWRAGLRVRHRPVFQHAAWSHLPIRRSNTPSCTRWRRIAAAAGGRGVEELPDVHFEHPTPAHRHHPSRRTCSAWCADRPGRKPYELSRNSVSYTASSTIVTRAAASCPRRWDPDRARSAPSPLGCRPAAPAAPGRSRLRAIHQALEVASRSAHSPRPSADPHHGPVLAVRR